MVVGGNAAEHDSPRREIERDVLFASFASCASLDGDIMTPGAPARADRSGHPAISPRLFLPARTDQPRHFYETVNDRNPKSCLYVSYPFTPTSACIAYLFPCHLTFLFT